MVGKVAENVAALRENGTPVGEIRVLPSPVGPAFFSNCSPLIPPPLSALLHAQLLKGRFINATNHIIGGWAEGGEGGGARLVACELKGCNRRRSHPERCALTMCAGPNNMVATSSLSAAQFCSSEDLKNSEWGAFRVYMSQQLPGEMQRMQVGWGRGDAAVV